MRLETMAQNRVSIGVIEMDLDYQQRLAVETKENRALIISGAGSGKTRTLIERIAYLVESQKVSPFEIASFSFSRKASNEIRERLESRIGKRAHQCLLGTMHSIALQTLRRFGEVLGLRPDSLTVYSEWESEYLKKEVAAAVGVLKGRSWKIPKKNIDGMFADYYERGMEPKETYPGKVLFDAFLMRCRENNAMTYGQLLLGLEELIPILARYLHIRHILVDEVQDIDPLQWRIINGMCEAFGASLFAVGDADQSIYAFRGACPEYLIEHQHEFDVFKLTTNYRSAPTIVEASNRLIRNNTQRIDKTMRAARQDPGALAILRDYDSATLADDIARNQGHYEGAAVLSRVHVLLKKLSDELTIRDIPHTYIGRKSELTNSEEFRRFHSFLKLIINPFCNLSFLLIKDLISLSDQDYSEIRVRAAKDGLSHFQAWQCFGGASENWTHFYRSAECKLFLDVVEEIGRYLDLHQYRPMVDSVEFIWDWLAENPPGTIKQYLDWLATYDISDEVADEQDGLMLLTGHAAKGLEYSTVILVGCNEGILPGKQAIAAGEIEEERRLAYVAMTRARDQLILCVRPERTEKDGRILESPVSRFVGEMA